MSAGQSGVVDWVGYPVGAPTGAVAGCDGIVDFAGLPCGVPPSGAVAGYVGFVDFCGYPVGAFTTPTPVAPSGGGEYAWGQRKSVHARTTVEPLRLYGRLSPFRLATSESDEFAAPTLVCPVRMPWPSVNVRADYLAMARAEDRLLLGEEDLSDEDLLEIL